MCVFVCEGFVIRRRKGVGLRGRVIVVKEKEEVITGGVYLLQPYSRIKNVS